MVTLNDYMFKVYENTSNQMVHYCLEDPKIGRQRWDFDVGGTSFRMTVPTEGNKMRYVHWKESGSYEKIAVPAKVVAAKQSQIDIDKNSRREEMKRISADLYDLSVITYVKSSKKCNFGHFIQYNPFHHQK